MQCRYIMSFPLNSFEPTTGSMQTPQDAQSYNYHIQSNCIILTCG